jgi:hypothetical protein
VRTLHARALLKMEIYRSQMKALKAKYGTTFSRFPRGVTKSAQENFTAWDDLLEWQACYRAYQQWRKRHTELRRWAGTSSVLCGTALS